jgi:hypothetical protein
MLISLNLFFAVVVLHTQAQEIMEARDVDTAALNDPLLEQFFPVTGLEQWHHRFDLSSLEPGTYHVLVRSVDKAGNSVESEAIDFRVSPESDLPKVSVSFPDSGTTISGDINFLGSATDDDGIAYVEVKIDDGDFIRAEGRDYWSYSFSSENFENGEHILLVRGVDTNGTQGTVVSVPFILDTLAPELKISSHTSGDRVSGVISISGILKDVNGIHSLRTGTSSDEEEMSEIKLKGDLHSGEAEFDIKIDTREEDDGLYTLKFMAEDLQKKISTEVLHLVIDNSPPVLEIISPGESEPLNGRFTVMGRAGDDVGLASLTFRRGKEEAAEIPLRAGDPFWSVPMDFSDEEKTDIVFSLTDLAGNVTEVVLERELDREGDMPVIQLLDTGETESSSLPEIIGWIEDDDSVEGITYILDGQEARELNSGPVFSIPLEGLSPGEHSLEIQARDNNGIDGEPLRKKFLLPAAPPKISFTLLTDSEKREIPYTPGFTIAADSIKSLSGKILFQSGSGEASYLLSDGTNGKVSLKRTEVSGEYQFQIRIPDTEKTGFFGIDIEARDSAGGSLAQAKAGLVLEVPGAAAATARIIPLAAEKEESVFPVDSGMDFIIPGYDIREAELLGGNESLHVSWKGNRLTLETSSELPAEDLRIVLGTTGGTELEYGPFTLLVDHSSPEWSVETDPSGPFVSGDFMLNGSVRDGGRLAELRYRIAEGNEADLPVSFEKGGTDLLNFSVPLNVGDTPDGPVLLTLIAEDTSGNRGTERILFIKDTKAPKVTQILPVAGDPVNGAFSLMLKLEDEWAEGFSGEILVGEEPLPLEIDGKYLTVPIELPIREEEYEPRIIVRDTAGNEALFSPALYVDRSGDLPRVEIFEPAQDTLVQDSFSLSGRVADDDGIAAIEYRLDDGEFQALDAGSGFDTEIDIELLSDNDHVIEVRALDLRGVVSEPAIVNFHVSRQVPEAVMLSPGLEVTSRKQIELSGTASDANGIEEVYVSLDNGGSFHQATGREEWTYPLNTEVMVDGSYIILIKVIDSYGVTALHSSLLTIDNTPPSLEISRPREGELISSALHLELRAADVIGLEDLRYSLSPIDLDEAEDVEVTVLQDNLDPAEVLVQFIETGALPTGLYNLTLYAVDKAANETLVSRNIRVKSEQSIISPELLFPLESAELHGPFTLAGRIEGGYIPEQITLFRNDKPFDVLTPGNNGYFSRVISTEEMDDGACSFHIEMSTPDGSILKSDPRNLNYQREGGWVHVSSVNPGDYVAERPWVEGKADYFLNPLPEGVELSKDDLKACEIIELGYSLDNGKQYHRIKLKNEWRFRLETQEMLDGPLDIIVRAVFGNNEQALTRVRVVVDKIPPHVMIRTPEEGKAVNGELLVTGVSSDRNGVDSVEIMLREGSKTKGQLPQFVQGLYIDSNFLGSTYWKVGLGLTFFDENVRIQLGYGNAPEGRFNGDVFGVKLLANVATLPYGYFFGPDWDFLSSSLALGSAFEYFSMSESPDEESGLILGALIAQLELVKIKFPNLRAFNTFSLYIENQLWFISSDVEGGLEYRVSLGGRVSVF